MNPNVDIMSFRKLLIALLPITLVIAKAHPGHGLMEHGAGHVANSAYHLFALSTFAAAIFAVAQLVRIPTAKKYLRLAGATVLIAAAMLWGF